MTDISDIPLEDEVRRPTQACVGNYEAKWHYLTAADWRVLRSNHSPTSKTYRDALARFEYVRFYKNGEFLYQQHRGLQNDEYRYLLLDWFEFEGRTLVVFHPRYDYSWIKVLDAETGDDFAEIHYRGGCIFTHRLLENEYLYIGGNFYGCGQMREIYHLPSAINDNLGRDDYFKVAGAVKCGEYTEEDGYEGFVVSCADQNKKGQWYRPELSLYGCANVLEFIERYDAIFAGYILIQEP